MFPARLNPWLFTAALLGGLAVAAGAFGAHALKQRFTRTTDAAAAERSLANWETAARYQMHHALALLAVGLIAVQRPSHLLNAAGAAMTLGAVIFSGCLYALVLTGQRWLGAVVPIGGVLLIVGWVLLAVASWRSIQP